MNISTFASEWAYKRTLGTAHQRTQPLSSNPKHRKVLFVIPKETALDPHFWNFVEELQLPIQNMFFVIKTASVLILPLKFVGRSMLCKPEDLNIWDLPKKYITQRIFKERYDIAIDLHPKFDIASAFLVNKSQANLKIGNCDPRSEPIFDLQLGFQPAQPTLNIRLLKQYMKATEPALLPFKPEAAPI
jgi:hypothetical protein